MCGSVASLAVPGGLLWHFTGKRRRPLLPDRTVRWKAASRNARGVAYPKAGENSAARHEQSRLGKGLRRSARCFTADGKEGGPAVSGQWDDGSSESEGEESGDGLSSGVARGADVCPAQLHPRGSAVDLRAADEVRRPAEKDENGQKPRKRRSKRSEIQRNSCGVASGEAHQVWRPPVTASDFGVSSDRLRSASPPPGERDARSSKQAEFSLSPARTRCSQGWARRSGRKEACSPQLCSALRESSENDGACCDEGRDSKTSLPRDEQPRQGRGLRSRHSHDETPAERDQGGSVLRPSSLGWPEALAPAERVRSRSQPGRQGRLHPGVEWEERLKRTHMLEEPNRGAAFNTVAPPRGPAVFTVAGSVPRTSCGRAQSLPPGSPSVPSSSCSATRQMPTTDALIAEPQGQQDFNSSKGSAQRHRASGRDQHVDKESGQDDSERERERSGDAGDASSELSSVDLVEGRSGTGLAARLPSPTIHDKKPLDSVSPRSASLASSPSCRVTAVMPFVGLSLHRLFPSSDVRGKSTKGCAVARQLEATAACGSYVSSLMLGGALGGRDTLLADAPAKGFQHNQSTSDNASCQRRPRASSERQLRATAYAPEAGSTCCEEKMELEQTPGGSTRQTVEEGADGPCRLISSGRPSGSLFGSSLSFGCHDRGRQGLAVSVPKPYSGSSWDVATPLHDFSQKCSDRKAVSVSAEGHPDVCFVSQQGQRRSFTSPPSPPSPYECRASASSYRSGFLSPVLWLSDVSLMGEGGLPLGRSTGRVFAQTCLLACNSEVCILLQDLLRSFLLLRKVTRASRAPLPGQRPRAARKVGRGQVQPQRKGKNKLSGVSTSPQIQSATTPPRPVSVGGRESFADLRDEQPAVGTVETKGGRSSTVLTVAAAIRGATGGMTQAAFRRKGARKVETARIPRAISALRNTRRGWRRSGKASTQGVDSSSEEEDGEEEDEDAFVEGKGRLSPGLVVEEEAEKTGKVASAGCCIGTGDRDGRNSKTSERKSEARDIVGDEVTLSAQPATQLLHEDVIQSEVSSSAFLAGLRKGLSMTAPGNASSVLPAHSQTSALSSVAPTSVFSSSTVRTEDPLPPRTATVLRPAAIRRELLTYLEAEDGPRPGSRSTGGPSGCPARGADSPSCEAPAASQKGRMTAEQKPEACLQSLAKGAVMPGARDPCTEVCQKDTREQSERGRAVEADIGPELVCRRRRGRRCFSAGGGGGASMAVAATAAAAAAGRVVGELEGKRNEEEADEGLEDVGRVARGCGQGEGGSEDANVNSGGIEGMDGGEEMRADDAVREPSEKTAEKAEGKMFAGDLLVNEVRLSDYLSEVSSFFQP